VNSWADFRVHGFIMIALITLFSGVAVAVEMVVKCGLVVLNTRGGSLAMI
jgi:hypothetical protein